MMEQSRELAKEWESKLMEIIDDSYFDEYTSEYADVVIETFEEAGILTTDKGIVVSLDGEKIYITIQAYKRR